MNYLEYLHFKIVVVGCFFFLRILFCVWEREDYNFVWSVFSTKFFFVLFCCCWHPFVKYCFFFFVFVSSFFSIQSFEKSSYFLCRQNRNQKFIENASSIVYFYLFGWKIYASYSYFVHNILCLSSVSLKVVNFAKKQNKDSSSLL